MGGSLGILRSVRKVRRSVDGTATADEEGTGVRLPESRLRLREKVSKGRLILLYVFSLILYLRVGLCDNPSLARRWW